MSEIFSVARFKPIQRRSFEDVSAQVRAQIADGSLRVGDRLPPERVLAGAMGVSRNTVREALRSLEYAGVLVQKPGMNGGAYVANGGAKVIGSAFDDLMSLGSVTASDLIEARIVIGREVARLACERSSEAELTALAANVEQIRLAAAAGNLPVRVRHNMAFNNLMAVAARNQVLIIMTGVLTETTMKFVKAIGEMPNDFVLASRLRMLDHLRKRDAEAAALESDAYLRTTLNSYLRDAQLPTSANTSQNRVSV